MVRIRGQKIRMKRQKKKHVIIGAGAVAVLAAVTLIAEGISYFSAETVDTKEGLAIIKAAEKENVKDIEKKINKLDAKDKLESQEASGEINYKSLFSSSVVMGDSISEAFTEYDLLNASSVVAKIGVELDELDDQIKTVADINPQVIFLSYGMNDVIATNGDTDLFIKEYKAVIDQLRKKLPDTTLYVNSIFPVSAAKQAGRGIIPEVGEVCTYAQALKQAEELDVVLIPYELAKGMEETKQIIAGIRPGQSVGIFIGPEGGFEEEEVALAMKTGANPVTLGKRILRTETAGLTMLSVLMFHLEG